MEAGTLKAIRTHVELRSELLDFVEFCHERTIKAFIEYVTATVC